MFYCIVASDSNKAACDTNIFTIKSLPKWDALAFIFFQHLLYNNSGLTFISKIKRHITL